jgi:hypothetical protein
MGDRPHNDVLIERAESQCDRPLARVFVELLCCRHRTTALCGNTGKAGRKSLMLNAKRAVQYVPDESETAGDDLTMTSRR